MLKEEDTEDSRSNLISFVQNVNTDKNYTLLLRVRTKVTWSLLLNKSLLKEGVLGKTEELWDSCESWQCSGF